MSDVQFEDQGEEFGRPPQDSSFDLTGKMVQWGFVSSRKEAEYVLIAVAVFALILMVYLFWPRGGGAPPPPPHMAPNAGAH